MNKLLLFALLPLSAFAQNQQKIKVKGNIQSLAGKTVDLQNANHLTKSVSIDSYGDFKFSIKTDTAYFTFGNYIIFLGPGMNLSIEADGDQLKAQGSGSAENNAIAQFNRLVAHYFPQKKNTLVSLFNSMEPNDFLKRADNFKAEAYQIFENKFLGKTFTISQRDNVDYTARYFTLKYQSLWKRS